MKDMKELKDDIVATLLEYKGTEGKSRESAEYGADIILATVQNWIKMNNKSGGQKYDSREGNRG